jgi:undecaprenyl-diphosphatase
LSRLRTAAARLANWLRAIADWVGRYELGVILSLLVIVVCLWAFIVVAREVGAGETTNFDEWAIRALRQPDDLATPIGPRWLEEVGRDLTALGGGTFMLLLTLTISGFLWLRGKTAVLWLVLASTFSGFFLSQLLKSFFDRPRPSLVPHLSIVSTSSFPSGHAMISAVVYLTLGTILGQAVSEMRIKAYFLLVALAMTFLVGVSRIYMGVHYPTDVLAGWSAGLAWALICGLIARRWRTPV